MKFKRAQPAEVMPKIGELIGVSWMIDGYEYIVPVVEIETLEKMRVEAKNKGAPNILGKPAACAIAHDIKSDILEVFPAPDIDLEIRVRFYPPRVEI